MSNKESMDSADTRREKEQTAFRERCDRYVESGLLRNVTIQFLLDNLRKMGCEPPVGFIRCTDCGDKLLAGAGFGVVQETVLNDNDDVQQQQQQRQQQQQQETMQKRKKIMSLPQCQRTLQDYKDQLSVGSSLIKLKPEIFLCQQHLRNETHAHESLVHELIHAIDMCRTNMDPLHNCIHLACTEIRAENLSGECSIANELSRISKFPAHGATCVKRRAALSLKANPNCSEHAEKYINAAFESCYKDTFPFDRHPNLR